MKTHVDTNTALPESGGTAVPSVFSTTRKCAGIVALLAAFFPTSLRAEEPVAITFAVPDTGLVTLGVFDKTGTLVRTLHRLAPEKDFRVDINGYMTRWDGKDDSGRRLPPGHYHLRGYLVGNITVEGEDFLFNDWATDEEAPKLSRIHDFSLLENGDLVLLAQEGSKTLVGRYSPVRGFLWSKNFSSAVPLVSDPLLATNGSSAIVLSGRSREVFSLENGDEVAAGGGVESPLPVAIAARPDSLFFASPAGLFSATLPQGSVENIQSPPPFFKVFDADATRLIGAGEDGLHLRKGVSPFKKIPLAANITSVSLGTGDTFWIVGSEPGSPERIVAQASPAGEILRTLRPEPGDPRPDKIRASRIAEKFATLESRPGLQRLRVMERNADGGWTIAWQRSIEECVRFGFVNDRAVADVGEKIPPRDLSFRLDENPLTGKKEILPLHAVFDQTGTRLVTPDGLPVVEVSPRTDISRIAICRGKSADTMRLLQGNGTFVEEFSISGIIRILPIDAGGVDLP